jgi:putative membrane protein
MGSSMAIAQTFPQDRRLHLFLWAITGIVFAWSGWQPYDRLTWGLEVFPVVLGTVVLLSFYRSFQFSRLVCWLLCLHALVLMVGGRYTYAEVPWFNALRDHFHWARNPYDRLGHFMQGFVPALVAREVFLRKAVVKRGRWLTFVLLCTCLAISASYELLEWSAALISGAKADAFLGTQGDPWDTQWDMAMALVGASVSLLALRGLHDRELARAWKP